MRNRATKVLRHKFLLWSRCTSKQAGYLRPKARLTPNPLDPLPSPPTSRGSGSTTIMQTRVLRRDTLLDRCRRGKMAPPAGPEPDRMARKCAIVMHRCGAEGGGGMPRATRAGEAKASKTKQRDELAVKVLRASARLRDWEVRYLPWFRTEAERTFLLRLMAMDRGKVALSEVQGRSSAATFALVKRLEKAGLVIIQPTTKGLHGPQISPSNRLRRLAQRYVALVDRLLSQIAHGDS